MKHLLIILLAPLSLFAQCEPDQTFALAASGEAHTEGFRLMAGVVGQRIPVSAFVGATTQVRIDKDKNGRETVNTSFKPVYELQLRLPVSTHTTSFNLYGNQFGAGLVVSSSIGELIAIRLRAGYEQQFIAGLGIMVIKL